MGPFPKYDIELKRIREEGVKEGFKIGYKEGYKIGYKEGYKEGYKIGIEIGVKRVAKNLLQMMKVEEVARQTGLTLEQVLALKEEESTSISD